MKISEKASDTATDTGVPRPPLPVHVERVGPTLLPDRTRVLMRPFFPAKNDIAQRIADRVMALTDTETSVLLGRLLEEFTDRHEHVETVFRNRFREVRHKLALARDPSTERQTLLGAYFSHEYSTESAALFNPSIVLHPDQTGLPEGAVRFVLSLRATGEGHISSITFRQGTVSALQRITLVPKVPFIAEPAPVLKTPFSKPDFIHTLLAAGLDGTLCHKILDRLPGEFTLHELRNMIIKFHPRSKSAADTPEQRTAGGIMMIAESNYEVRFNPDSRLCQRILFPSTPSQSNGIEDARFSRFRHDDGSIVYYATYTAYDGRHTLPQLLETRDFIRFRFSTLSGPAVHNKGMALFPCKINGRYAMLSRQDDENILLMYSDDLHIWRNAEVLLQPAQPWELVKIGTCGSPIQTPDGWLILTHGVGPMRKYCLGAVLLDLADPGKIIGRLRNPLLAPNEAEREGYVPNVVYTCGALIHGPELIIPYAMSDSATSFATVVLRDLLQAME